VLQNAAKYGKLVENYGNFGGSGVGAVREAFSPRGHLKRVFLTARSVAEIP
jgi:hypothetical protein